MSPAPLPTDDPGRATSWVVAIDGVPGTALALERRGDVVEIVLDRPPSAGGSGPTDAAPTVEAIASAVRTEMADPALAHAAWHLAADHRAEDLDPVPGSVAEALGLRATRELLQLRRPLPVPADHPTRRSAPLLAVRAYRPGSDDDAWLRVNNRAFADHPDQGQEDHRTLGAQMAQPWFDPDGFLVADDDQRPGALSGFCWTKVHPADQHDGALGEIYVIGVDPSHQGEGLGPALVLAGLDHLAARGIGCSNLYVEADNHPALRLYDHLGYHVHQRRRVYAP